MKLLNTILRLYPSEWRIRYEEEFAALIEQNHLSLLDIGDIAFGALDAHMRPQVAATHVNSERSLFMNSASFTKWSGMAGMAGSVLVLLGLVGTSIFSDKEYPYTYNGLDIMSSLFFVTGVALTLLFAAGFALTYARRIGGLGQAGLLVTLIGLLSMGFGGIGHLAEAIRGTEIGGWWEFFIFGLMGTLAGAAIFCLAGSKQKVLPPVGSKLVMVGGFGVVAMMLLSIGIIPDTNYEAIKTGLLMASMVSLAIFEAGLFLIGYALWTKHVGATRQIEPATMG